MKYEMKKRVLAMFLVVVMVIGLVPTTVFATESEQVENTTEVTENSEKSSEENVIAVTEDATDAEEEFIEESEETADTAEATAKTVSVDGEAAPLAEEGTIESIYNHDYYNVISENNYNLAPGAVETQMILNNSDGTDRKVVHFIEVDPDETSIEVMPGYYGIDKLNPNNLSDSTHWATAKMTDMVAYYENVLGYNVVGAMNTSLAYDSDAPYDIMVYNGTVLADPANHSGSAQTYLAVTKNDDGTVTFELRSSSDGLKGNEWQAVSANFGWLVKEGVLTKTTVERESSDASRSMLGIKSDGTLVICQVDGRNAPTSTGLSNYEMGELMQALGCVWAVNGDGGGSSSFVTKREGTNASAMRSVPSDGSERNTINGIMVVSTAQATGEFHHAILDTAYDYYAPGTSATVIASGVDASGSVADIPTDVTWALSDNTMGTIEMGTFISNGTLGDVNLQMLYKGIVVGEKTIHVVNPDGFAFDTENTVVPYGKSVELVIEAFYGADNWAVCIDGVYTLALSNAAAAVLDGNVLTATIDESISGLDVIATYISDITMTDTLEVAFGKGSEVFFDFEDGDISNFLGVDEAYQWVQENNVPGPIFSDGNFSSDADSNTFLATNDNGGQVKHGNNALGVTLDYTNAQYANWSYNMFFYTGQPYILRDVANGNTATTFGMWVYIPEGAAGLAMQLTAYVGSYEKPTPCQIHFEFTANDGTKKKLNACAEADIPESRWVYATADLTPYDFLCLQDATKGEYREPSFIRFYVKPTLAADLTFYFDDFTLDYSSAVEDRVLPTIDNVNYATSDTAITLMDNAVIDSNIMAFAATVADNVGLDATSGKILVDGVAIEAVVSGSTLSSSNVTLTSGAHIVSFEIQDKLGNIAKVTRTFTVGGEAAISLTGHNDSGKLAETGSIYYADITVADIEGIDSITATLKLQTANTWEPEGITVAEGFKADYEYNEISRLLTVSVERVADCILSGNQNLVSIPIRVWSWEAIDHVTKKVITPESQFATGNCPVVTIDCEIVYGTVEFVNDVTYLGVFSGAFSESTNINDNVNPWHTHDEQLSILNQETTCITSGYTNRTYCETCQSVVDWGTTDAANGHKWGFVDGVLLCTDCEELFTGIYTDGKEYVDGIIITDGWFNDTYYYLDGVKVTGQLVIEGVMCTFDEDGIYQPDYLYNGFYLADEGWCYYMDNVMATGWIYIDSNWHYFLPSGYAATGSMMIDGKVFDFEGKQGKTLGAWVGDEGGTRLYIYSRTYYKNNWAHREGASYYFNGSGYRLENGTYAINAQGTWIGAYEFDADGQLVTTITGVFRDVITGCYYYAIDGELQFGSGLIEWENNTYYVRSNGQLATTAWYVGANALNNLASTAGTYKFSADGKMIKDNGPKEVDGMLYFYIDGVQQYGLGLIEYDGSVYYVRSNGCLATTAWYVGADALNGLAPTAGTYEFGTDGKMIKDNGPKEVGGVLYFYIDGVQQYGLGLVEYEDSIYYVRSNGRLATTAWYVDKDALNGLVENAGTYEFGADGKMIKANGPKEVGGALYFYIDGVQQYGLGLVEHEGSIYYVRSNGCLATTAWYVGADALNGLAPTAGTYEFGTDGKMIKDNGPKEVDGMLYFYIDGVQQHGLGLIEYEGSVYYVRSNGRLATTAWYVDKDALNGLVENAGTYEFGADGKMIY